MRNNNMEMLAEAQEALILVFFQVQVLQNHETEVDGSQKRKWGPKITVANQHSKKWKHIYFKPKISE